LHPEMSRITFEVHSLLDFRMEMVEYPELHSSRKWVQKGIDLLKRHTPRILHYFSKQHTLGHLKEYKIIIKTKKEQSLIHEPHHRDHRERLIRNTFLLWIKKERLKRVIYMVIEGVILPVTPFLAILPGPNVFFYIPALLLYYHYVSFKGLRKINPDELYLEIQDE
jgi:hypothetical protein